MAKALIPADDIYDAALTLLDEEGLGALSAQRLVKVLKISTKTLYSQVGNRDQLIRALVTRHFARLELQFVERDTWESTALQWCQNLHAALRAHPHLTQLMTIDDRTAVTDYTSKLIQSAEREGFSAEQARQCVRVLANVTINQALVEARALTVAPDSDETSREVAQIERCLPTTVRWILAGCRSSEHDSPMPTGLDRVKRLS